MRKYNVQETRNGMWGATYAAMIENHAAKLAFAANPKLKSVWVDSKGKPTTLIYR